MARARTAAAGCGLASDRPSLRRAPVRRPRHGSHDRTASHVPLCRRRARRTVDGIQHIANLPTEEIFTAPDPTRADGVVSATKPLDVSGTVVRGLRVRFEAGRAVEIEAESGADALRARCAKDEGASRLGEVALVDREGRIGKTGITSSSTRCSTRTRRATSRSGTPTRRGRRRGPRRASTRAPSTSTS